MRATASYKSASMSRTSWRAIFRPTPKPYMSSFSSSGSLVRGDHVATYLSMEGLSSFVSLLDNELRCQNTLREFLVGKKTRLSGNDKAILNL